MKVISVANQKGGCGKTITAVNLSASLSKKGHKVLLIDLDPQAHATFSLNQKDCSNITDILENTAEGKNFSLDNIYANLSETFSFISSSIGLASLEHKLSAKTDKLKLLSSFLRKISSNFDYCLIDCPPSLGILTLNALEASHYCLIPLSICDFSLKGVELLKNILIMVKEFKGTSPAPFYLLSQVDTRSNFSKQFVTRAKEQLKGFLLHTTIRANIHLREAVAGGKDIFQYKADSRGAEDFTALAEEIKDVTSTTNWVPFFLKNNNLEEVYIVGDFNDWRKTEQHKLKKINADIWSINLALEPGKYRYKFLSGDMWFQDPHNKTCENDSFGGKHSLIYV